MKERKIVISLGGSLVFKEKIDYPYLKKFSSFIARYPASFGIVVGGGKKAKEYIDLGRKLDEDNFDLDMVGIAITKANARIVKAAIPKASFFEDVEPASNFLNSGGKIAVLGGTTPGHTTDTVAALLAEDWPAEKLLNLSLFNGIHDKDPTKFKGSKQYSTLSYEKLIAMATEFDKRKPRENFIFDLLASKIIQRSKIETHFLDGKRFDDIKKAIEGKKHSGTVVR